MIEQFLELILPRKWWEKVDAKIPKAERRRLLLWLCALAFIYASFSAYDDVNKRLRLAQERSQSTPIPFELPVMPPPIKKITPEQAKTISVMASKIRSDLGRLVVGAYLSGDNVHYSISLVDALMRAGIEVNEVNMAPDDPAQTGVMIACDDPGNMPDAVKKLKSIFTQAGIDIKTIPMLSQAKPYRVNGCMLFIGPSPL